MSLLVTTRMNTNHLRNLILVPWLSVPVVLTGYLFFFNRLPSQLAVHFTSSGNTVTLMSRERFLLFALVTLLLVLSIGSWQLWRRKKRDNQRVLVRHYFATVVLTSIFLGILLSNI
jgi:membrane-anchored protein YejM (alkaline phosphatase superfamily)